MASLARHSVASFARRRLIFELADEIVALRQTSPTLVAIEGRSAAGKTSMADELAVEVHSRGRPILRSSIDDFHTPGHKYRSMRREYTPESYIASGYDYAGFCRSMIDPLQERGDRLCKSARWNSGTDTAIVDEPLRQADDVIAIVDGALLFHPLLEHAWHFSIWLEIDWHTMIERAARRDIAWVESEEEVRRKYRELWRPLHERYEATLHPRERCNVEIDNRDVAAPVLIRYSPASAT